MNVIESIQIPKAVDIHEDAKTAVRQQNWVVLKEVISFLDKVGNACPMMNVIHWMIQEKEIPLTSILHVLDTCLDSPLCSLFPTSTTLLQRAISVNRVEVMQALIRRGHALNHEFNGAFLFHPLILAFHPFVSDDTFQAILSYYVLSPESFLSQWIVHDKLVFYVPLSHAKMTWLVEAGASAKHSHFELLCADSHAMISYGPSSIKQEPLVNLLLHYIAQRNENVSVHLANQFMQPFRMPSLAAIVLRSNFRALVTSVITTLYLAESVVAEGKSAMLIAAEANADESCRALMDAKIDGDVEGGSSWTSFQITKPNTAYRVSVEKNSGLASELLAYNARRVNAAATPSLNQ